MDLWRTHFPDVENPLIGNGQRKNCCPQPTNRYPTTSKAMSFPQAPQCRLLRSSLRSSNEKTHPWIDRKK